MKRAVHRARPPGPDRSLAADDFDHVVMLESGQCLGDDGIGPLRPLHDSGEVVIHPLAPALRRAEAMDGLRVAATVEPPHDHVEEVDGLLEDPGSDAAALVAPAAG